MSDYDFKSAEDKWQTRWTESDIYRSVIDKSKPKHYAVTMLPYTSGDLHIGHWYAMAPSDVRARWMRMRGYNVLFPIGFDAFGLPAENAAIQRNIHPASWTYKNVDTMRRQIQSMGAMFDWKREAVTCAPEYYRWSQWLFLQFYKNELAYKQLSPVDWCPQCNTTLAREQVWGEDRHCERCNTPVIKKDLNQWYLRITDYAEELLDFSRIEWPDRVQAMQTNWIGRSEGVEFEMQVAGHEDSFRVFTTRPDTIFGVTFAVLAPEHGLVDTITTESQKAEVEAYREAASRQTEIERLSTEKERDGVFTGAHAVHPFTGEGVPIYVADYVLTTYGTGAIMAVPAHDDRDFDFATRYGIHIPVVIAPEGWDGKPLETAYIGQGTMVNSGEFDGLSSKAGWGAVADRLQEKGIGEKRTNYRLRDWLISRQRYWGCPIPMIECPSCGLVAVPEEDLPVLLPSDAEFLPTGESPLKLHEGFRNVACPACGEPGTRETDTMDTFICSSWYQYRYLSPDFDSGPFDTEEGDYWLPVDQYTGGIEHATMHLLYTRFFTKAMRDMGLVEDDEPMLSLFNQGIILGEDSEKMSKSRGNVVSPDELVGDYGTDAVRLYLMFISRWDQGAPWNSASMEGAPRFLNKTWGLLIDPPEATDKDGGDGQELRRLTHQTIRKVTEDIDTFSFNTAVAALMTFANGLQKAKSDACFGTEAWEEARRTMILLLAPMTPFFAEELWEQGGGDYSVHDQAWPEWDPELARPSTIEMPVQINGRVRAKFEVSPDATQEEVEQLALEQDNVKRHLEGANPKKVIVVPNRLVNIVV
ncbi:MAG: leucine--tRNA ligase [Gemmatimonadetes bacterium]|nr:leucine--tRNA ligase [Gemmatimonadota bacterium]|tara:strand:+ start:2445 stop:4880 length:2436 start_codon:yes stop_codon:yes gene_type:complete